MLRHVHRIMSRFIAFLALSILCCAESSAVNISYAEAARQAANWIVATALPAPTGIGVYWPPDLTGQDADASYNRTFDLYSGVSGVIVFLLEVHTATGDSSFLATATAAGKYLAAATPEIIASNTSTGL